MPPTELLEKPEEIVLKCVIVVEAELPLGTASNAIAILEVSLASHLPGMVGPIVTDGSGAVHKGLLTIPLPILQTNRETMSDVRRKALKFEDVSVFDFVEPPECGREGGDRTARKHRRRAHKKGAHQ